MADIIGTNADDYMSTTDGDDRVDGRSGNDVINGSAGNDVIDGGQGGNNQVDYDGRMADYSFTRHENGSICVTKPNGGVDTLSNIGGLWFCQEDRWVAIDDLPYDENQNDAPVATNDWAGVISGEPTVIDVLANDCDPNDDTLQITAISGVAMQAGWNTWVDNVGLVSLNEDGTLTIESPYPGEFCFEYTVSDGNGGTSTAMVEGTSTPPVPVNSEPVAKNDWVDGTVGTVTTINPLANDSDADGDTLSITAIDGTPMKPGWSTWVEGVGKVTVNAIGTLSIDSQYVGDFCFEYTITDGNGGTSTATIEGTSTPPANEAPVAIDDVVGGEAGDVLTVSPLDNDSDADGDTLTISKIDGTPMQAGWQTWVDGVGLVTLNADNTLSIEPIPGATNIEFSYTVCDANGGESTATVTVEVEQAPVANGAIGDRVWVDADGNGLQDDGEVGMAGVTVNLKDASGTIIDSQQTDANGNYRFETLVAGDYYIGVVAPDGYSFAEQDVGDNNYGIDSDVDVDNGISELIHLRESQIIDSADAGLVKDPTASVGDRVWNDANGNGVQDNGEAGAKDIAVQLKDADGIIIQSQQTDGNGNYLFENVAAGQYSVSVIAPDGYGFTEQDAEGSQAGNDSDVDVDTGTTDAFEVKDGQALTNVDAGLIDTTTVSTETVADTITTCEDETTTFNVLDNDQGEGLRLVNVTHESAELQAEFESRGGELSFDADGNVTYTGMSDYYGNDVLIYTLEDANGECHTQRVEMTLEAVSDASVLDVTDDFQQGRAGYREDKSYQKHITHHSTAERIVYTQFFEKFVNDETDAVQQFGDYNTDVADDQDKIAYIELYDAEDNGAVWKLDGEVIDPVNDTVRVSWGDIKFGKLTVNLAGIGTEHKFNYRVVDTGGDVSSQKGANVSNGDFVKLWTPIALDLNDDDKIGVTGETSSHQKDADAEIGRTVEFDIDADGDKDTIEWFDGSGDGILVDTSKIGADGSIDGSALFGDEGGKYSNGYEKLEAFDTDGDGNISGDELDTIGVWVDDGDAVLEEGELKTTNEAGIASVSTQMEIVLDDDGNELMQSTATTLDGEVILTEDVWFAEDQSAADETELPEAEVCEDCFG